MNYFEHLPQNTEERRLGHGTANLVKKNCYGRLNNCAKWDLADFICILVMGCRPSIFRKSL